MKAKKGALAQRNRGLDLARRKGLEPWTLEEDTLLKVEGAAILKTNPAIRLYDLADHFVPLLKNPRSNFAIQRRLQLLGVWKAKSLRKPRGAVKPVERSSTPGRLPKAKVVKVTVKAFRCPSCGTLSSVE